MRSLGTLAAVTLAVLAAAGGSPGAAERGCVPAGFRTVEAGADVRVVRRSRGVPQYAEHLACYRRVRRPVVLGDEFSEESLTRISLAGRFVALRVDNCPKLDECESFVQVADTRSRRKRLFATGPVVTLLVARSGAFAGVVDRGDGSARLVVSSLRPGSDRVAVLGSGADIEPSSLALAPGRVYWTQGGEARTAALGG